MPKYRRGDGSVFKRGRKFWLSYYVDGRRVRESTEAQTPKEARTLLQKKLGERATGSLVVGADKVTYDELAAGFLADYRANGRRTLRNAEMRLRLHLTPFFSGQRAHATTPADVTAYIAHRQGEGAPNGTIGPLPGEPPA